jgi:hypothetical protein
MTSSEAKTYHVLARECLRLADETEKSEHRDMLIELSRIWTEAALQEERHALKSREFKRAA